MRVASLGPIVLIALFGAVLELSGPMAIAEAAPPSLPVMPEISSFTWDREARRAMISSERRHYDCELSLGDWVIVKSCRPVFYERELIQWSKDFIEGFFSERGCEISAAKTGANSLENEFNQYVLHRLQRVMSHSSLLGPITEIPMQFSTALDDVFRELEGAGRIQVIDSETTTTVKLEGCT